MGKQYRTSLCLVIEGGKSVDQTTICQLFILSDKDFREEMIRCPMNSNKPWNNIQGILENFKHI